MATGLRRNLNTKKYTDEQLLDLYTLKAEELGRKPTNIEIRDDPRLPSPSTYKDRFCNQETLIRMAGLPHLLPAKKPRPKKKLASKSKSSKKPKS